MEKKYFKKIIANSADDLKYISACCYQAKASDIKFLKNSKIFLIYLERYNVESDEKKAKINSIIKCEYVQAAKSKNINQKDLDLVLELITIDVFKKQNEYEIVFLFSKGIINLTVEIIEISLEDVEKNDKSY
tara:strand:- start:1811 stop:2206 length:396 start_codon:yes stop_codon:yes gene_type:complete